MMVGVGGGLGGVCVTDSSELESPESLEMDTRSSKKRLEGLIGLEAVRGWGKIRGNERSSGDSEMKILIFNTNF